MEKLYTVSKKKKKRPGANCGSVHELLMTKFRLKLKKVGKTTRPLSAVLFSSVAQWCPTLCEPMNRRTPGLPVHHHLPALEKTQMLGKIKIRGELWDDRG